MGSKAFGLNMSNLVAYGKIGAWVWDPLFVKTTFVESFKSSIEFEMPLLIR